MTKCASSIPLIEAPDSVGLLKNVENLSSGKVRLRLEGHYMCLDVGRPFYRFDILNESNQRIGEMTFLPETDTSVVEDIGHAGGVLDEGARGKSLFIDALRALSPLARQHGLSQVTVVIPESNAPAIAGAKNAHLTRLSTHNQRARFALAL